MAATLAMQDYMEAAAVVFLFTIAEWLETRASYKVCYLVMIIYCVNQTTMDYLALFIDDLKLKL